MVTTFMDIVCWILVLELFLFHGGSCQSEPTSPSSAQSQPRANNGNENPGLCQSKGFLCDLQADGGTSNEWQGVNVCSEPFIYKYNRDYCKDDGSKTMVSVNVDWEVKGNRMQRQPSIFFRHADMLQKTIALPSLDHELMGREFPPSSITASYHLSTTTLDQYLHLFNISTASLMGRSMRMTLDMCQSSSGEEEEAVCVDSPQAMVSFAAYNIGSNLKVDTAKPLPKGFRNPAEIRNTTLISRRLGVCHDAMFPYLIFACHVPSSSMAYRVELSSANTEAQALAVCHMDTTSWSTDQVALRALKMKPGEGEVCHWVPENTHIWFSDE